MTRPSWSARTATTACRTRRGMSLVEIIVAIALLGIVMALAGRLSFAVTQFNRANDLRAKRGFAMQQQANFVGVLPYASLNATTLPATKSFTTGSFSYQRRIAMTSSAKTTSITITIIPNTGVARDTLQRESMTIVRSMPPCGTVLNVATCAP